MDIGHTLWVFWLEKSRTPFDWEQNNCCLFAADWAKRLTGHDPASRYREQITSPIRALRILEEEGGVERLAARSFAMFGWPAIDVRFASRGDIVLAEPPNTSDMLGVCAGSYAWFTTSDGIANYPTLSCKRAWKLTS